MNARILASFVAGAALIEGCAPNPNENVIISEGPRHPVTERMTGVTDKLASKAAPEFSLPDAEGRSHDLKTLLAKGPVVVYSIKDECPCSVDAQPLLNDLAKRYKAKSTFIGLYNETPAKARKWGAHNRVNHPVVIDQELTTYRAFKAERSVYVTLIDSDGKIVKTYPGYWKTMLLELDGKLGKLTGIKLEPFDTKYAPNTPSSGCQLYEGEGYTPGEVR